MAQRHTPRIAKAIADGAFSVADQFPGEFGAELIELIDALCSESDAEWLHADTRRVIRLRKQLDALLESYQDRRVIPPLRRSSAAATYYLFIVTPDDGESGDAVETRRRYALHMEMIQVLRDVNPSTFERLCALVLENTGCSDTYVTRKSQDRGVDFFGRMPLTAIPHSSHNIEARTRVFGSLRVLLFGQAKRYAETNRVSEEELKHLEASWNDTQRARLDNELAGDIDQGLKKVGWRAADPVLLVFATTSRYTARAMEYAERKGVATLDGDQLAQLLLDLGIGAHQDHSGRWSVELAYIEAAC